MVFIYRLYNFSGDVFVKKQLVEGTYDLKFTVKDGCEKSKTDTLTIIVIDDVNIIIIPHVTFQCKMP